ncbi:MAG: aldo/keto reductase [Solobacterium sp.]|nr:aldo/keto reductase [Solobacterium sp.]MBR3127453.1 aldo/keto reductase [Solobacterium sp.]
MEYQTLHNGITLPVIGFGTWDVRGKEGERTLREALDTGYRLIDTAQMYDNEEIVGKAVRESGIPRSEIFVTTKLSHPCPTEAETLRSIHTSLARLGLDYVDLLLIHEPYRSSITMYRALEQAYDQGLARAIGISNFQSAPYRELLQNCRIVPMVNQIESHVYYMQLDQKELLEQAGTKMQAWASFTEGRKPIFAEPLLNEIARRYGRTAGQIALRYQVQNGIMVIPKTSHRERMEENIDLFDFVLTEEDMRRLSTLDQGRSLFNWYTNDWMKNK